MNLSLLDPFQCDYPEVIEEYLEHGVTKCIAFNRRGTLLAAGCEDGSCVIWDFDTRGVAKELRPDGAFPSHHGARGGPAASSARDILSVSWSKGGHKLLASGIDKTLSLWDVAKGVRERVVRFESVVMWVQMHPRNDNMCLASPQYSPPLLVELGTGNKHVLPAQAYPGDMPSDTGTGSQVPRHMKNSSDSMATAVPAIFDKRGENVFIGTVKGDILIFDLATMSIKNIVTVPGGSAIRQLSLSRNGRYLLTLFDKVIRVFENVMASSGGGTRHGGLPGGANDGELAMNGDPANSPPLLRFTKEFQEAVARTTMRAACFSGDAELVMGATREHKITMWNRNFGHFAGLLEGPKEGLLDLAWHPTRPIVATVSSSGVVNIWAKDYTENWSAFAPDFKELEENEEYVEREDEFDVIPEEEKVKPARTDEGEDVDIETVERVAAFSDSDDDDGLYYLPTIVERGPPENLGEESEEAGRSHGEHARARGNGEEGRKDGTPGLGADSAAEDDGDMAANGRPKRKRKVTEKAAESLQARLKLTPKRPGDTPSSSAKNTPLKRQMSLDGRGVSSQLRDKALRKALSPSLHGHSFEGSPGLDATSERSSNPEDSGLKAPSGDMRRPIARPKDSPAVTSQSSEKARNNSVNKKKKDRTDTDDRRRLFPKGHKADGKKKIKAGDGKVRRKLSVEAGDRGKLPHMEATGGLQQQPQQSAKRLKVKVARYKDSGEP